MILFVIDQDFDDLQQQAFLDDRQHRKLDQSRREVQNEEDAEEIAKRLQNRYKRSDYSSVFKGDLEHVPQRLLIPSVNDPKLWLIKCKVFHLILSFQSFNPTFV